jgi:hypothetical protein
MLKWLRLVPIQEVFFLLFFFHFHGAARIVVLHIFEILLG